MQKLVSGLFKLLIIALLLSSCKDLNPSVMFKTGKKYKFAEQPKIPLKEYKIANNDQLEFKLYSNDGFKLIDITSLGSEAARNNSGASYNYKVEFDGTVKLPIIGRIKLEGMTLREAEVLLEDTYSKEYVKPFVILNITNRRVIVFPGSGGSATVINLANDNTTLIEALAQSGGITQRGKADRVKIIRGDLRDPQVFLIDLSTIEGVKKADMVLQENDIIYVEPAPDVARNLVTELSPYLSLATSVVLIITYVRLIRN